MVLNIILQKFMNSYFYVVIVDCKVQGSPRKADEFVKFRRLTNCMPENIIFMLQHQKLQN